MTAYDNLKKAAKGKEMTSGPGKHAKDPGRDEEVWKVAALKELSFQLFQIALARRRVEDIIRSGDIASITYYRELNFVHEVLSNVHVLLRSVAYGPQDDS